MSHPIRDILIQAGYPLIDSGEFWKTKAIYRNGACPTSLSVNKKTGRFMDFGANNLCGSPEELVKIISGENASFATYIPEPEAPKMKLVKTYPKEILKRLLPHYDFFLKRGVSKQTLELFEAGMAHSGKLNRRICFPLYNRADKIVGFTGRWFQETPPGNVVKWKILGPKRLFLWPRHINQDIVRDCRELIILESLGDALKLWEAGIKNTMVIFGLSLSSEQLSYILSLDLTRIIIATNNDSSNQGRSGALKIAAKLNKHFDKAYIGIHLPETANDFGQMPEADIKSWQEKIKFDNVAKLE